MDKRFLNAGSLVVDGDEIVCVQYGGKDTYGWSFALITLKSGKEIDVSEKDGELALFKAAFEKE